MSDYKGVLHETAVRFPDTDIWMDSCGEEELDYGLARGIVGATSNRSSWARWSRRSSPTGSPASAS